LERRLTLHAGSRALTFALAFAAATSAHAAPHGVDAKAQFDRGAGAYNNNDYAEASEAFAKSFALEPDPETLFAWAQAERKLGHCGKAIELYDKLLVMQLPSENREAVTKLRAECQQLADQLATAQPHPIEHEQLPPAEPRQVEKPAHWWQDGFGDALLVAGVAGLAVGGVFLVQAHNADQDKATATNYFDYKADADLADSRGKLGVVFAAGGGIVLAASIVHYVVHGHSSPPAGSASAWVAPNGGGVVWSGRF
jgi:tetratricopeptide (TPR) repeat protein